MVSSLPKLLCAALLPQHLPPAEGLQLPCEMGSVWQLGGLRIGLAANLRAVGIEPGLSGATNWPVLPLQERSGMKGNS